MLCIYVYSLSVQFGVTTQKVYELDTLTLFYIAFILDNTGFLSFRAT